MEDIALEASLGEGAPLDCNHGRQKGDICLCDSGWGSSGIDSNLQEHWCDVLDDSNLQYSTGPIQLTYLQELIAIIVSSNLFHLQHFYTTCTTKLLTQFLLAYFFPLTIWILLEFKIVPQLLCCIYILWCIVYSWTLTECCTNQGLSVGNLLLLVGWVLLVICLCCRNRCCRGSNTSEVSEKKDKHRN